MAAEQGNKYAEKWTLETVMPHLRFIEQMAKNGEAVYLTEALLECGLYPQIWSVWAKKFKDSKEVYEAIKRIEGHFEKILFKGALNGDCVPSVAIFGLKNNHNWKDKTEQDVNLGGEVKTITGMVVK